MTPLVDRRPDYDELLRLAEAATEEAWDLWSWASWQEAPPDILDGSPRPDMFDLLPFQSRRNVAFAVEARPDVVAALIRENRQQAADLAEERAKNLRLQQTIALHDTGHRWPDGCWTITADASYHTEFHRLDAESRP